MVLNRPFSKPEEQPPALQNIEPVILDGISGFKYAAQGAPYPTVNIELPYQSKTLLIMAASDKQIEEVYEQMLTTFKYPR